MRNKMGFICKHVSMNDQYQSTTVIFSIIGLSALRVVPLLSCTGVFSHISSTISMPSVT